MAPITSFASNIVAAGCGGGLSTDTSVDDHRIEAMLRVLRVEHQRMQELLDQDFASQRQQLDRHKRSMEELLLSRQAHIETALRTQAAVGGNDKRVPTPVNLKSSATATFSREDWNEQINTLSRTDCNHRPMSSQIVHLFVTQRKNNNCHFVSWPVMSADDGLRAMNSAAATFFFGRPSKFGLGPHEAFGDQTVNCSTVVQSENRSNHGGLNGRQRRGQCFQNKLHTEF